MTEQIRWGILGTGNIAKQFARGLTSTNGKLVAVGSRTREKAEAFAGEFNVPRIHANYESLANDNEVDAVYIATPHDSHKVNTLLCLDAGKAVLCEKPFAINAKEAGEMIAAARARNLFLMEAMWSRFLPYIARTRKLIGQGIIGRPHMMQADFGFRAGVDPEGRLFNPRHGGGGLLDVGIYTISLASMLMGIPKEVKALARIGETGVDVECVLICKHPEDALSVHSNAIRTTTPQEAVIMGSGGVIRLHAPWWKGDTFTCALHNGPTETLDYPLVGNGYNYEAEEVMKCLREGAKESAIMPLDETLALMGIMDEVRAQIGLKYPME